MGCRRLFFKRFAGRGPHNCPSHKDFSRRESTPMNPLNTVRGAMISGFVLALLVTFAISPTTFHELGLARWFHILAGITWIGLLYYFCLLYTSDAADERSSVDLGGRRIIKK